jgi:ATP-binding cassette subfamily B protein
VKLPRSRPIPVILQMTAVECGAACLAMILSFWGRATRVSELRDAWGIGRDGVTAHWLAAEARRLGLRTAAVAIPAAQFGRIPLPAIVHWQFDHFLVVERWSPKHVVVVDPAIGRRRLSSEEFELGFTGVVLAFEPGAGFEPRDAVHPPQWRTYLASLLRLPGAWTAVIRILLASACLQLLGLVLPVTTELLVDHVLPERQVGLVPLLGLGLGVAVLSQLATSYVRAVVLVNLRTRLDARVLVSLFEHALSLPLRFFQQRSTGDLLLRVESAMDLREILTGQMVSLMLDGALVLVYLALILTQSPLLGAVVLAIGALQVAMTVASVPWQHELLRRDLTARGIAQSYLAEAFQGIATLKAAGAEERASRHWGNLTSAQLEIASRRGKAAALVESCMGSVRTFAPLVVLAVGAIEVLDGRLSLGALLAFQALAGAMFLPLWTLVSSLQQLQLVGATLERISDISDAAPEQELDGRSSASRLNGKIELIGVSFRYGSHTPWVLRNVSLTVEPGQTVALVGRTGSGKSTLAQLLLGLLAPTEGEIRYDGVPMSQLDLRTLRRQCGVVLQEPTLFSGSLRDNIALHDPEVPLEEVVAAARLAAIHDDIQQMPMGYSTRVAEGGAGLSGGQRQRLALARALAQRPSILLLDEATSNLDVLTEGQVQANLNQLACTRVVIAHRLSTVRNADVIVLLEDGSIAQHGSHERLLVQGGAYAQLVRNQEATGRQVPALIG